MTYPSNSGDSVADDLLRNGFERWERLEGEKAAIGEDLKELFAELKGHGFTPKALRESFRRVRDKDSADKQEHDAIVDLYVASLTGARPAPARVENIEEFPLGEDAPEAVAKRIAALKANPALAIVDAAKVTTPNPNESEPVSAKTVAKVTAPTPEPQPDPQPLAVQGDDEPAAVVVSQPIQPETANEKPETSDFSSSDPQRSVAPIREEGGSDASSDGDADKSAEAPASAAPAPKYAEPGVVTWESCPPEGVERHEYSAAFGTFGQDIEVIKQDLIEARAEPIIKIGNKILDGWARFMAARDLGIEYPVMQYDGQDFLVDCIKWNLAGRILTNQHKQIIAKRLIEIYPQRKGVIINTMTGDYDQ